MRASGNHIAAAVFQNCQRGRAGSDEVAVGRVQQLHQRNQVRLHLAVGDDRHTEGTRGHTVGEDQRAVRGREVDAVDRRAVGH